MARYGLRLVYGGGDRGLMGAVAEGVLEGGGDAVGVIPRFMVEAGWHHRGIEQIQVEDMSARKKLMEEISDGCIALPGSVGTLDELMETVALKKLGLYLKPIVILNTNGFFAPLQTMLQKTIDEQFMHPDNANLYDFVDTPAAAIEKILHTPLADADAIWNVTQL